MRAVPLKESKRSVEQRSHPIRDGVRESTAFAFSDARAMECGLKDDLHDVLKPVCPCEFTQHEIHSRRDHGTLACSQAMFQTPE